MSSSPMFRRPTRGRCDAVAHRARRWSPSTRTGAAARRVALVLAPRSSMCVWPCADGNGGHDRRTLDARDRLQHEMRHRRERAGVAGAHARERPALLHEVDGDAHRGVLLAPDGLARRLVHRDDFGGAGTTSMRSRSAAGSEAFSSGPITSALPTSSARKAGILAQRAHDARDVVARLAVAAHHVDGDGLHARDDPRRSVSASSTA